MAWISIRFVESASVPHHAATICQSRDRRRRRPAAARDRRQLAERRRSHPTHRSRRSHWSRSWRPEQAGGRGQDGRQPTSGPKPVDCRKEREIGSRGEPAVAPRSFESRSFPARCGHAIWWRRSVRRRRTPSCRFPGRRGLSGWWRLQRRWGARWWTPVGHQAEARCHTAGPARQRYRLLAGLYRLAPGVLDALKIVRPETVIRRHLAGFRAYWRWKSRLRGGRPKTPLEVRQLIRKVSLANPLRGAPRIHGEGEFHRSERNFITS
jgi:hypothetical protein